MQLENMAELSQELTENYQKDLRSQKEELEFCQNNAKKSANEMRTKEEGLNLKLAECAFKLVTEQRELESLKKECACTLATKNKELESQELCKVRAKDKEFEVCHQTTKTYALESGTKDEELKNTEKEQASCYKSYNCKFREKKLESCKQMIENLPNELKSEEKELELNCKDEEDHVLDIEVIKSRQTELESCKRTPKNITHDLEAKDVQELKCSQKPAENNSHNLKVQCLEPRSNERDFTFCQETVETYANQMKVTDLELKRKEIELKAKEKDFEVLKKELKARKKLEFLLNECGNKSLPTEKDVETHQKVAEHCTIDMLDEISSKDNLEFCQKTTRKYTYNLEPKDANDFKYSQKTVQNCHHNMNIQNFSHKELKSCQKTADTYAKEIKISEMELEYLLNSCTSLLRSYKENESKPRITTQYHIYKLKTKEMELQPEKKELESHKMTVADPTSESKADQKKLKFWLNDKSPKECVETYQKTDKHHIIDLPDKDKETKCKDMVMEISQRTPKCKDMVMEISQRTPRNPNNDLKANDGQMKIKEGKLEYSSETSENNINARCKEIKAKLMDSISCQYSDKYCGYNRTNQNKEQSKACQKTVQTYATEIKDIEKELECFLTSTLKSFKEMELKTRSLFDQNYACNLKAIEKEPKANRNELEFSQMTAGSNANELKEKEILLHLKIIQEYTDKLKAKDTELDHCHKEYASKLILKEKELQSISQNYACNLEAMNNELKTKEKELEICQTTAKTLTLGLKANEQKLENFLKSKEDKQQLCKYYAGELESRDKELKYKDMELESFRLRDERNTSILQSKEKGLKGTQSKLESSLKTVEYYADELKAQEKKHGKIHEHYMNRLRNKEKELKCCETTIQKYICMIRSKEDELYIKDYRWKTDQKSKEKELENCHKEYLNKLIKKQNDLKSCQMIAHNYACELESKNMELKAKARMLETCQVTIKNNADKLDAMENYLKAIERNAESCMMTIEDFTKNLQAKKEHEYKNTKFANVLKTEKELVPGSKNYDFMMETKENSSEKRNPQCCQSITDKVNVQIIAAEDEETVMAKDVQECTKFNCKHTNSNQHAAENDVSELKSKIHETKNYVTQLETYYSELKFNILEGKNSENKLKTELESLELTNTKLVKDLKKSKMEIQLYKEQTIHQLQVKENLQELLSSKERALNDILEGKANIVDEHKTRCDELNNKLSIEQKGQRDLQKKLKVSNESHEFEMLRIKRELAELMSCLKRSYLNSCTYQEEVLQKTKIAIIQGIRNTSVDESLPNVCKPPALKPCLSESMKETRASIIHAYKRAFKMENAIRDHLEKTKMLS